MKKSILLFCFCAFAITLTSAQRRLNEALRNFERDTMMEYASWGFCAMDVQSGKIIASHDMRRSLIPASSMKTMTTSAALGILGGNYRIRTELQHDGSLENGVLNGNLYIKGYGDPSLGSPTMEGVARIDELANQFLNALKKAGITSITGSVIADDDVFSDKTPDSWQWNDLGGHYGTAAFGLNINENLYSVEFQQAITIDSPPVLRSIVPMIPGLELKSELISGDKDSGDNSYIFGAPYENRRVIRGSLAVAEKAGETMTVKGAIPDPPTFIAFAFNNLLQSNQISVAKSPTSVRILRKINTPITQNRRVIYTHQSPPLRDIVKRTNERSVNLYAEALLKLIAYEKNGKGTTEDGLKIVKEYWESQGLNFKGLWVEDGSGLSPRNLVHAYGMANMMRLIAQNSRIREDFRNSLPIAGQTGTLTNWLKKTNADGVLRAKTGSMTRVVSYTGYTKLDGKDLAFSLIVNNYDGKMKTLRSLAMKILMGMTDEKEEKEEKEKPKKLKN